MTLTPVHLDARGVGGGLAGADGGAVAAEAGVRLQHVRADQHDEPDHHHVGDAERRAGDPGEVVALGDLEGDRLLAGDDERGGEEHAAHRQRGDERRDAQAGVRQPRQEPGERAQRHRQHEGPVAERGERQRHHHAGERGHGLDREVDPAQHDDEGDAGGEDEEDGGVAGEFQQRRGLQEDRLQRADQRDEDDEGGQRQPLAQAVGAEAVDERRHQTMCPIRSTWRGLAPGLASARWVIAPSRMTRTVWLRPMVSSSVSEVRITPRPSAVTARTSS